MANHNYTIIFKSLRTGTTYTVTIGGGSGTPIQLSGGSQPFTTEEDSSEDIFIPIRTQTGYIRIVDDGKDYNGNSLGTDWWKDLIPQTATDRPVTLTAGGSVVWQGFMQPQSFSGTLYGNPQDREFPVQCCLSVLDATQVKTDVTSYQNFAYLLDYIFGSIPTHTISQIVIQGGADARGWLRKKLDWRNFLNISEGDVSPQYSLYQILEDVCRYWGWTARTFGQQIILTTADDMNAEPNALTLTTTELHNIGQGTSGNIGSVAAMYSTASVGSSFASTDNEDTMIQGRSKVVVNADCNKSSSEMAFAPQSVRDMMESHGYSWNVDPDNSLIGYFSTQEIASFSSNNCRVMEGGSSSYGGFSRRQIYGSEDAASPDIVDCIDLRGPYTQGATPKAWLASVYEMSFPGGSFDIKGSIYEGWERAEFANEGGRRMKMAIGIGPSRTSNSTQWLNLSYNTSTFSLVSSWSTTKQIFDVMVKNVPTLCPAIFQPLPLLSTAYISRIPVDANLSGRVFVEFYGSPDEDYQRIGDAGECNFEIADFTLTFSRDAVSITGNRERTAIKNRLSTREYSSVTNADSGDTQTVDCIFASDNDMDYGFGLLMNADGSFMATASYNGSGVAPERYLANRMAAFWGKSRRVLSLDLDNETISPLNTTTVNDTLSYPIAISKDWRDDMTKLTLIEL